MLNLEIRSEKGNVCHLNNPWKGYGIRVTENGVPVKVSNAGEKYSFATRAGKTYMLFLSTRS
ncbi:hypothetical protein [Chitinophaga hostae]|uniref:Uncharacterized protein n=1 Tax=Chitinophaga hostae TaxID=2831022 RepID=A0ABS5J831_9BACT|nr:hypothetical protein [Chitinophaga hostae]MBS0031385.1 hypothetical protein [Chitinophaga hostae]